MGATGFTTEHLCARPRAGVSLTPLLRGTAVGVGRCVWAPSMVGVRPRGAKLADYAIDQVQNHLKLANSQLAQGQGLTVGYESPGEL